MLNFPVAELVEVAVWSSAKPPAQFAMHGKGNVFAFPAKHCVGWMTHMAQGTYVVDLVPNVIY